MKEEISRSSKDVLITIDNPGLVGDYAKITRSLLAGELGICNVSAVPDINIFIGTPEQLFGDEFVSPDEGQFSIGILREETIFGSSTEIKSLIIPSSQIEILANDELSRHPTYSREIALGIATANIVSWAYISGLKLSEENKVEFSRYIVNRIIEKFGWNSITDFPIDFRESYVKYLRMVDERAESE